MVTSNMNLTCLASSEQLAKPGDDHNFFKSAEWTADGTTIITNNSDNTIRTYIVPPDLLDEQEEPHHLSPYTTITHSEPITTLTPYPFFDLPNAATTLVLRSTRDHPIGLCSTLTAELVASYPLVNPSTEAYIHPSSLSFTDDGTRFLAGSDTLISTFDLSRPGAAPTSSIKTGSRNRKSNWSNPSTNLKGIVSALCIDPHSRILAAGTFSRDVALYDAQGQGECLGAFSVKGSSGDEDIGGSGITQVQWSPCGRYLNVVERMSDGVSVYDIRKTGQLLSWVVGRNAYTNQRMSVDLVGDGRESDGYRIWAGGMDGVVRSWKNPHHGEGRVEMSQEYKVHDDVVSRVSVHPTVDVMASCSGQRRVGADLGDNPDTSTTDEMDSTLKIWLLDRSKEVQSDASAT